MTTAVPAWLAITLAVLATVGPLTALAGVVWTQYRADVRARQDSDRRAREERETALREMRTEAYSEMVTQIFKQAGEVIRLHQAGDGERKPEIPQGLFRVAGRLENFGSRKVADTAGVAIDSIYELNETRIEGGDVRSRHEQQPDMLQPLLDAVREELLGDGSGRPR